MFKRTTRMRTAQSGLGISSRLRDTLIPSRTPTPTCTQTNTPTPTYTPTNTPTPSVTPPKLIHLLLTINGDSLLTINGDSLALI